MRGAAPAALLHVRPDRCPRSGGFRLLPELLCRAPHRSRVRSVARSMLCYDPLSLLQSPMERPYVQCTWLCDHQTAGTPEGRRSDHARLPVVRSVRAAVGDQASAARQAALADRRLENGRSVPLSWLQRSGGLAHPRPGVATWPTKGLRAELN